MNEQEIAQKKAAPKSLYEVLPPQINCPNCSLHMSYVGDEIQDRMQAYKVADQQHWQRMQTLSGVESNEAIEIPPGYKCMFCGVRPLSTSKGTWRLQFGHFSEADSSNKELRNKILKRDNYTCCDCRLRLPRHMEVRHLDEDHANNEPSNLVCVCPFCHMRDHLGPTGFAQAAYVVGSSRISQAQMNIIVLLCWYITDRVTDDVDIRVTKEAAEESELELAQAADRLLNELYTFGIRWTESLSKAAIDPFTFGTILTRFRYEVMEEQEPKASGAKSAPKVKETLKESAEQTEGYKNRSASFSVLSLLPRREAFKAQCNDWFKYLDGLRPAKLWSKGFESFLKKNDIEDDKAIYEIISAWNKIVGAERNGTFTPILPPVRAEAKAEPMVDEAEKAPATATETQAALVAGGMALAAGAAKASESAEISTPLEKALKTSQDAKIDSAQASALESSEKSHTARSGELNSEPVTNSFFDLAESDEKTEPAQAQPVEPETPSFFDFVEPEPAIQPVSPPQSSKPAEPDTPSFFDLDPEPAAAPVNAPAEIASNANTPNLFDLAGDEVAQEPAAPPVVEPKAEPVQAVQQQDHAPAPAPAPAWGAWGQSTNSTTSEHDADADEANDDMGGDFVEDSITDSGGDDDDGMPRF